jgi:hypothetical protein
MWTLFEAQATEIKDRKFNSAECTGFFSCEKRQNGKSRDSKVKKMSETKGETVREIKFINFSRSKRASRRVRERKAFPSFIRRAEGRGGKANNNELP